MKIYCAAFSLDPQVQLETIIQKTCHWISQKTNSTLRINDIQNGIHISPSNGHILQAWKTPDGEFPQGLALDYRHVDPEIRGRQWITQIGARRHEPGNHLDVSILLQTDEQSTQVRTPARLSVPRVVEEILNLGTTWVPGRAVFELHDLVNVQAIQMFINNPSRRDPVFLVSVDYGSGHPLVDVKALRRKVQGLADITVIPGIFNREMTEIVGYAACPRGGAISILWAERDRMDRNHYFYTLFNAATVRMMGSGVEETPEEQLLAALTQRTNWINGNRHITPEMVRSMVSAGEFAKLRKKAEQEGNSQSLAIQFEKRLNEVEEERRIANEKNNEALLEKELQIEEEREKVKSLTQKVRNLEAVQLATQISLGGSRPSGDPLAVLRDVAGECFPPRKMLEILSSLFPDHLVVLDSAYASAQEAEGFRYCDQLWEGLWLFATVFWEELAHGHQGDTEARRIFGSHYAANESETTRTSRKLRQQRMFSYKDQEVFMERHLKYGTNNPSPVEGIRIHFHWDGEEKRLVIGHCGRHLDTKSKD